MSEKPDHLHWLAVLVVTLAVAIGLATYIYRDPIQVSLTTSSANNGNDKPVGVMDSIPNRGKSADAVVVGKVNNVSAAMETDEYGGKVIVTHVSVGVGRWMKGSTDANITVDMLGGTVSGVSLNVSDQPAPLKVNEQAVLFLEKKGNGHYRLAEKDLESAEPSALKLKGNGHTEQGDMSVDQVQAALGGAK